MHLIEIAFARTCLSRYSFDFGALYGKHHLVYNMHGITHLADDCKRFGSLNQISTFPFESFLGRIKRILKAGKNPLGQLYNKIHQLHSEETPDWLDEQQGKVLLDSIRENSLADSIVSIKEGPLQLESESFMNFITAFYPGQIVKVMEIPDQHNYIECVPLKLTLNEDQDDFYDYYETPLRATQLGIYVADGLDTERIRVIIKEQYTC